MSASSSLRDDGRDPDGRLAISYLPAGGAITVAHESFWRIRQRSLVRPVEGHILGGIRVAFPHLRRRSDLRARSQRRR